MQGYKYTNHFNNKASSSGISPTLQDLLLPIQMDNLTFAAYRKNKKKKAYQVSHFIQTARTLCDLGFLAKYRHLSDDSLMLEILCMRVDEAPEPCYLWEIDGLDSLFLEKSYLEILELDTERILCCPWIQDWRDELYANEAGEYDPILELDADSFFDEDEEEMLGEDTFLDDEDCEEVVEESRSIDEDCQQAMEEIVLCDRDRKKPVEYRFNTLLYSLEKLSHISRSKFMPENIVELEHNYIQFDLEGKIHHLRLNEFPYEASLVALQINRIIAEYGYQFELFRIDDINGNYQLAHSYDIYIILLSEEEKEKLSNRINGIFNEPCIFPRHYMSLDVLYGTAPPEYHFNILLEVLGDLSKISRGQFIPQNIVEMEKESIQFNLNNRVCSIFLSPFPCDLFILAGQINPMIAETGYQFEAYYYEATTDFFICLLSESEKKFLKDKKRLKFFNCWQHYYEISFSDREDWFHNLRRHQEYYSYMLS